MTKIASRLARRAGTPMLVGVGIALLAMAWLTAGLAESPAADPVASKAPSETLVVGFGHVDVDGGVVSLATAIAGRVDHVSAVEGERVRAGQPLLALEAQQAEAKLAEAEAAVEHATIQRRQADRAVENLALKRKLQMQAIQAAKTRAEAHQRDVDHAERLAGDDVIPNERLLVARDMAVNLKAAVEAEEIRLAQLELENPAELVELAETNLKQANAKREQAKDFLQRHTLTAPADGIVLRISTSAGQAVNPGFGGPVIWFAPDKPRVVRCEFDQAFADRVRVGMRAEVHDSDGQRVTQTGVVQRVGPWIAPKRSVLDEPFLKNDVRTLECIIALEEAQVDHRIGERMRVVLAGTSSP